MRIAFVQTYPIYHDHLSVDQWLALENRDRWMPGILAADGHEVELWAGGDRKDEHRSQLEGLGDYTIRIFHASGGKRTKFHSSRTLIEYARAFEPELVVLKGTDGGLGVTLLHEYLHPESVPFAFVIGGKCYTRSVTDASAVLYETEEQRSILERPGYRLWRPAVPTDRLIHLPKSVDTSRFRPLPLVEKEWDLLIVSRLSLPYKNFDSLAALSRSVRIAVAGSGPAADELRERYPEVEWLGFVDHDRLPEIYNRARVFFHPGRRDYFPRVITEAAACGIPCTAFADSIAEDVLPDSWGLRLHESNYVDQITSLLASATWREEMGRQARVHAERSFGRFSTREPMQRMLSLLRGRQVEARLSA